MLHWTPFSISFFFLFFMLAEILLLFGLADEIGAGMTWLEIFVSAFVGYYFIKNYALKRLSVPEDFETAKPIMPMFQEIMAFLIAGLLLILPGIITDFIGLLLAIPHLRWQFMNYFEKQGGMEYTKNSETFNKVFHTQEWTHHEGAQEDAEIKINTVIEGEFYEVDLKKKGDKDDGK